MSRDHASFSCCCFAFEINSIALAVFYMSFVTCQFSNPFPIVFTQFQTLIMAIQKVILAGANGILGPTILKALLSANTFEVSVLSRKSSTSKYPDSVKIINTSDDPDVKELVNVLQGQDAVIVSFSGAIGDLQIRLADAAVQAGVKRFIPADYGSCDSSNPRVLELMPLYVTKKKVREHLQQLESKGLTWTSIVSGHFFDWGLKSAFLQFNLKTHTGQLFDTGDIKWSTSTLETIATAVVRILEKEDVTKNQMLYIQSFCISQNELLKSLEKATPAQNWNIKHVDSEKYIKDTKTTIDNNPNDAEARENLVSVVGIVDASWGSKNDNALLGLQDEDLDEVINKIIADVSK
jgi:putative NADH-flavin reductase